MGTGRSTKRAFRITGLRFYFLSWEAYIDLDILINKRFEEFTVITVYMVYGTNEFKKIPPPPKNAEPCSAHFHFFNKVI